VELIEQNPRRQAEHETTQYFQRDDRAGCHVIPVYHSFVKI
jgi:hypothetical protein